MRAPVPRVLLAPALAAAGALAVLGEPGIAKSVLLNRLAQDAAAQGHWCPRRSGSPAARRRRRGRASAAGLRRGRRSVEHLAGGALSQLLTAIGDALNADATARDATVTTHLEKLPIAVYPCGLPELAVQATEARATFARRLKPVDLDVLDAGALRQALRPFVIDGWPVTGGQTRVRMEPRAAEEVVSGCDGSPCIPPEDRTAGRVAAALGRTSAELGSTARDLEERHGLIRRVSGTVVFRSPGLARHLRDAAE